MVKRKKTVKRKIVKKKSPSTSKKVGSIIIDSLNSQLLIYPKDNFGGDVEDVRAIKIRGDKQVVLRAISMGVKHKVKVFDRHTGMTLNFKKLLFGFK